MGKILVVLLALVLVPAFAKEGEYENNLLAFNAAALIASSDQHMLMNISPNDALRGMVMASPSRENPDYYAHWVRDAALSMRVVMDRHFDLLYDYVDLSKQNQNASTLDAGLGEVKFDRFGHPITNWMRPQNDGPALRAVTLIKFARGLIARGQQDYVRAHLYAADFSGDNVIKRDLEYVAHHWMDPSFDLWEETYGQHFYTLAAQKDAMLEGAVFARAQNDPFAGDYYEKQADLISMELEKFWDSSRGYLVFARNIQHGPHHESLLDVAVILAALHSARPGEPFGPRDDRILATAFHLKKAFTEIYGINRDSHFDRLGRAIGRYPEDVYDGLNTGLGANPWFLATSAYAELYYRAKSEFKAAARIEITDRNLDFFNSLENLSTLGLSAGQVIEPSDARFEKILQALRNEGDRFIDRVAFHMNADVHLSEQFNRDTGYEQGARDLTWSYAALITALSAR